MEMACALAAIVLFLEIRLFRALPDLYSYGFMEYTYKTDHYIS